MEHTSIKQSQNSINDLRTALKIRVVDIKDSLLLSDTVAILVSMRLNIVDSPAIDLFDPLTAFYPRSFSKW